MRWVGRVACVEEKRNILGVKKKTEYLEEQGIVGRIILRLIFMCVGGLDWIYLAQYRDKWQCHVTTVQGQMAVTCDHSHEPSRCIKSKELLEYYVNCQLVKKDCSVLRGVKDLVVCWLVG
jgi:hypothetical protein